MEKQFNIKVKKYYYIFTNYTIIFILIIEYIEFDQSIIANTLFFNNVQLSVSVRYILKWKWHTDVTKVQKYRFEFSVWNIRNFVFKIKVFSSYLKWFI